MFCSIFLMDNISKMLLVFFCTSNWAEKEGKKKHDSTKLFQIQKGLVIVWHILTKFCLFEEYEAWTIENLGSSYFVVMWSESCSCFAVSLLSFLFYFFMVNILFFTIIKIWFFLPFRVWYLSLYHFMYL